MNDLPPFLPSAEHAPLGALVALSSRQAEVLELISWGLTDVQMASRLRISPRTVRMHADELRKKFNVRHRRELIPIHKLRSDAV